MPSPIPNTRIHIVAQVTTGLRNFILLQDFNHVEQVWLNEVSVTGNVYEITDDSLFHDLYAFLAEQGLVTVYANQDQNDSKQGGVC